MGIAEIVGYLATAFNIAAYSMRTMIPLRIFAITSNAIFVAYGVLGSVYPVLVLHALLLPLNSYRLYQMLRLVRSISKADAGELDNDWLKPFMSRRRVTSGDVLFRRGEVATELFMPLSGRFRLVESGRDAAIGHLVGELGFIAPDNHRTQTLACVEQGDMLVISYDDLRQLFFQNPQFGFYFLRLTTGRLFDNLSRLQGEAAAMDAPGERDGTGRLAGA